MKRLIFILLTRLVQTTAATFFEAPEETRVEGRYIVVLRNDTQEAVATVRDRLLNASDFVQDLNPERTFQVLKGFSLEVKDDGAVLNALQTARERRRLKLKSIIENALVDFVEEVRHSRVDDG
jgi:hypothetical protein